MDETPITPEEEALVDELLKGMISLVDSMLPDFDNKEAAIWRLEQAIFVRKRSDMEDKHRSLLNAALVLLSATAGHISPSQ